MTKHRHDRRADQLRREQVESDERDVERELRDGGPQVRTGMPGQRPSSGDPRNGHPADSGQVRRR